MVKIPFCWSDTDRSANRIGPVPGSFFRFGRPITVIPLPLGRPRFLILAGSFTASTGISSLGAVVEELEALGGEFEASGGEVEAP